MRPFLLALMLLAAPFWLGGGAVFAVDTDGDGIDDDVDNCPLKYNPGQEDRNADGVGDSCSNEIYVVPAAGFVDETTVAPGLGHSISIHFIGKGFDCTPPGSQWSCFNGWTIYSPDGADWDHLAAAVTPEFLAATHLAVYRRHFHKAAGSGSWVQTAGGGTAPAVSDGSGTDSAGFSLSIAFDGWIDPGWAGPALEVEFASHPDDVGRHVCIDSCKSVAAWEWACWAETSFPAWDHSPAVCYEIGDCFTGLDSDEDGMSDACDQCPGFDDFQNADLDPWPDGCDPYPMPDGVALVSIDGLRAPDLVAANRPLVFKFRVDVNDLPVLAWEAGLQLSSPDGAVWQTPVLDTVAGYRALTSAGGGFQINNLSVDGTAADTLVLSQWCAIVPSCEPVLAAGLSEVLFSITTRVDADQAGRYLVLDTVGASWQYDLGGLVTPQGWSGTRTFAISPECCIGRVGDVNVAGGDEPTMSDVSLLIDHLFISGTPLPCLEEADVNQSGGASPSEDDITISDIAMLIDYLFITGPQGMTLPECL